jgi:hypothetical protein
MESFRLIESLTIEEQRVALPRARAAVNQKPRPLIFTAALRDLCVSICVNAVCPYLLYQYLLPRFPTGSLAPLACSSAFPIFGLTFGLARRGFLDFIALLALLEVAVGLIAIAFSNTAPQALIGRSLPNAVLAVVFLISVLLNRPIMSSIARQVLAGSDSARRARFDQVAFTLDGVRVFRVITLVWTAALLIKCAISLWSAVSLSTSDFLLVSPAFNYALDIVLVIWGVAYGKSRLRHADANP